MGYRSEVVLAIAPEAAHAFMTLTAQCPEVMRLCQDADQFESGYQDKGDWFIRWSHIKWYDSYPEVAMIEKFIEGMECDELDDFGMKEEELPGIPSELFKFVRIGEDNADVEQRGYGFENIYVTRAISF